MGRGVRIVVAAVAAALMLPAGEAAACSKQSWTAGAVELCRGTLVYRDYMYDDYGANRGSSPSKSFGTLSPQAGDDRYPDDLENSADLIGVELRVKKGRLQVRFPLSALYKGDETIAGLAIDYVSDSGGGEWPGFRGIRSDGWDVLHKFTNGDPARNEIRGSVPLPPGNSWRVHAVAAQKDGTVMNVAFRGTDELGAWWENNQAAALQSGDISKFGHTVKVSHLVKRKTRPAALGPGFYQRVHKSAFSIDGKEGYDYDGVPGRAGDAVAFAQDYHFLGRHQPYGVYVPKGGAPHGVQLVMHGFGANHRSLIGAAGMQANVGEARNRLLVTPLGRGMAGFYSDYSERDVLDVLDDVERSFRVDRERVFAGGYSMGGYGTLRLGALYADRFAGYINWVGFTGDDANGSPSPVHYTGGAIGNAIDFIGNLRHVPGANMYGTADELVHIWTAEELNRRFAALGIPYIYYFHPAGEHFTYAVLDDWRKESAYTADLVRVRNPARVTYRTQSVLGNESLGIRHDRAYWVREIRPAGDGYADVDLTTHACGGSQPETAHRTGSGPDPEPWTSEENFVTGQKAIDTAPRLTGELRGVRSLVVDAKQACLRKKQVTVDVKTDVPATLRLTDGRVFALNP